ncbi:hypothetical protein [Marinoscillum furvescens]|uniref:Uncharacterized protein n=1 Tax=Marinoscillum furvescens DSM 4134 TaxID=1122208 RepID=A0A3D9L6K7_MARFU|nr:hypothetical protein [Marinoscillum furvescens]REE01104.1 hypothetical protein C7460_104124 [Marinoscillum furvescens DSM 4134]
MAITIISQQPTDPCFSKNVVAWKVSTTNKHAVVCRLFVETSPHSGTYEFVTALKAWPDSNSQCTFYVHDLLEADVLNYDAPVFFDDDVVMANTSRRIKCEFYEDDPAQLELVEEIYHEDSDEETLSWVDITALETGEDYIVVLETDQVFASLRTRSGASTQNFNKLYELGDELWLDTTDIAAGTYDELEVPGYTNATIYKGLKYTIVTSDVVAVLLGGYDSVNMYFILAPPDAPSNLHSTVESDTENRLTWTDNSENETVFEIERSLDRVTGWTKVGEVIENVTEYIDDISE